jgi:thiol-disulfide isomerase/thioredoxin
MMTMNFKSILAISFLIALGMASCDVLDPPYYGCTDPIADNYNSKATHDDGSCEYDPSLFRGCTDSTAANYDPMAIVDDCHCHYENVRKVLVEDYTGHTCGNCPYAADVLKDLECEWGDRVVPLAVHVGFFAEPQNYPDGSYSTNFRTPAGNQWNTEFGNSAQGLPNGLINRRQEGGSFPQSYTVWQAQVANLLAVPADATMSMTNTYSEGSRTVNTSIDITAINDLNSGPYNVIVCLTEDSVVDWQKDYDPELEDENVPDYVHMHVLRDNFNGTWGDQVGSGNIASGTVENMSVSLTIDQEWDENNCNVVAFIYRTDNKEVIQAEYRPVIE